MTDGNWTPAAEGHSTMIRHPQLDRILEEVERCRRLTRQYGEPYCMSIEGRTGAGKTRLAEELVRLDPPHAGPQGVVWPVFHFQLPGETTPKRVAMAMIKALGDPTPGKDDPTTRVVELINDVVRDVVILDDFHHLLNLDTIRRRDAVSDLLKVMIKKTKKVFVIIGIEGKMAEILDHNPQLARLFACRMELNPFPLDPNASPKVYLAQLGEFDLFVQQAAQQVGVELAHGLPQEDFLYRMHRATDEVAGNTLNLLRYAGDLAVPVGLPVLAEAYDQRMGLHSLRDRRQKNPFEVAGRSSHTRSS